MTFDTAEGCTARKKNSGKTELDDSALSGAREQHFTVWHTRLPPLSLLSGDKGKPDVGDIKANANIIKSYSRELRHHGGDGR